MKKSTSSANTDPKTPFFKIKSTLARYVDNDELKAGHVSSAAFMPNLGESHLSVNSVEIESLNDIAIYYCDCFQHGVGSVAISCRKVIEFNEAAKKGGIKVSFSRDECKWKYRANDGYQDAYRHRPTRLSISHCGVEYLGDRDRESYLINKKIARRLAGNRPHLYKTTT